MALRRPNQQRPFRLRGTAAILTFLLALTTWRSVHSASADSVSLPRLAIPTYFTTTADWTTLLATPNSVGFVMVNPASGPGTSVDPTYAAIMARIRSAGVRALGYVSTQYGARPLADVLADMARYRTMYGVTSFFFDETPNVCNEVVDGTPRDHVQYYGQLFANAHTSPAATAVLNPGTNVPPCFLPISDVIVTFEATAATYATWSPDPWTASVPAEHFWHLVHSVPVADRAATVLTAAARRAGYLYATTEGMPNPWAGLGDATSFAAMRSATLTGRTPAPTVAAAPPATRPVAAAAPSPSTTVGGSAEQASDADVAVSPNPVAVVVAPAPTVPVATPPTTEVASTTTTVPVLAVPVATPPTAEVATVPATTTPLVTAPATTALPVTVPARPVVTAANPVRRSAVTMPPIRVPVVSVQTEPSNSPGLSDSWTDYGHSDLLLLRVRRVVFGGDVPFAH